MGVNVKREFLSAQNIQQSSLQKISKVIFCSGFFLLLISLISLLTSCTNITSISNKSPTSTLTLSDPTSGTGGSFQLTGVYASQQSPGTMFDMTGANSEFDTYCVGTVNGPCACEYTYNSPGIGTVTTEGAVQYQESNLLRCLNVVPTGVTSFDVKILAKGSSLYSNVITTNLSSGSFVNTNYIDLSKEEAYLPVKRFQCRKREFIANPMSQSMIDPIQSEDPKVIYPFNFYSTNIASSLWQMQQLTSQDWDCTLTPTNDRSLQWWANPNVYSASTCTDAFCAGDAELMYPQDSLVSGKIPVNNLSANGKRRSSFYLAKQSYGVFQVSVMAAVGPSTYVSSQVASIGYAARPIPNVSGSSACPNITLPSNAIWVKLWNFRATDITSPKKVTSSPSMNSTFAQVACNPVRGIFPSCDNDGSVANNTVDPTSHFINSSFISTTLSVTSNTPNVGPTPAPNTLATRVVFLSGGASSPNACYNITSMGSTIGGGADGTETWQPSGFAFAPTITQQNMFGLPWGVYQQVSDPLMMTQAVCTDGFNYVSHTTGMACTIPSTLASAAPSDSNLTTLALSDSNYSDQMFVVSSSTMDDTLMRNQALSASYYNPVTYRTSVDCNSASQAGCPTGKEIHWSINIKDVGAPTGPDQYPLCVLQFTD